jgi:hypothetical protein
MPLAVAMYCGRAGVAASLLTDQTITRPKRGSRLIATFSTGVNSRIER